MVGTESHLRSFNTGIICSYFLVSVRILAAKFWIFCNFRTLVLLVLAQTVEQKYSLLNTRDVITFSRVLESRRYLILLISRNKPYRQTWYQWHVHYGQEFIASICTPRSPAEAVGAISFPSSVMWKSGSFCSIWRVPITKSLVLFALRGLWSFKWLPPPRCPLVRASKL